MLTSELPLVRRLQSELDAHYLHQKLLKTDKRLGQLAQGSQSLFLRPTDSYGPWIDKMYEEAIKTNRVTFNDRVDMAKILRDDSPLAGLTGAGAGAGAKADDKKADATTEKKEEKAPAEKK